MRWSPRRLPFGADYNPEQWSPETWPADIARMRDLGVTMVTLGVFSWARLEPGDGQYEFGWLDEILGLLDAGGIRVDLATATASPPAWLVAQEPSVAAVNRDGVRLSHGGRQHYSPSSRVYREKSLQLVNALAERYATHPALEMWHVNNELGCHTPYCFGDESAVAFRLWLRERYGDITVLNDAWQTTFWSQSYASFEEIIPPRRTPVGTSPNPAHQQDFRHFSSDQLLAQFVAERDVIRRWDTAHPVTTNFMTMRHIDALDYWKWAQEVDFVSTDHYVEADNSHGYVDLAFQADLTRGLAGGQPWLLMEHSPAAVNWQPRNIPKTDAEIAAHAMSHIFRGSQGVMFFQFKQSWGGSERFHSAMVPHVGEDSRIYRAMRDLGRRVEELSEIAAHPPASAEVALIVDYHSSWAIGQDNLPSVDLDYGANLHDWYRALFERGVPMDCVSPDSSAERLSAYRVVLAPMLHVVSDARAQSLSRYVANGGVLVTSYFSGAVDEHLRVHLEGYGGRLLREVCGVAVEEYVPLAHGDSVALSNGFDGMVWAERARSLGAEVLAEYRDHPLAMGSVALSRNSFGKGEAWYLGTQLSGADLGHLLGDVVISAGCENTEWAGWEIRDRGEKRLVINRSDQPDQWGSTVLNPGDFTVIDRRTLEW